MLYKISGAHARFFFASICPRSNCLYVWHGADKNPALLLRLASGIITILTEADNAMQDCPVSLKMHDITVVIRRGKPIRYLIKTSDG